MRPRGFSVVEVLLALAILSIFIIPLISLATGNRREVAQSEALLSLWVETQTKRSAGDALVNPTPDGRYTDATAGRADLAGPLYVHQVAEASQRDVNLVVEGLTSDPLAGVAPVLDPGAKVGP